MALVVKPSVDWPRRIDTLTGNEDLLKQNPVEDLSPQEERIPTSLIADYTLYVHQFDDPSGDLGFYTGNTLNDFFNHIANTIVDLVVSGAVSTLVDNGDGTYTYNNGVGIIDTINVNAINSYIIDSNNYYTGDTVEEALTQIGYYLNDIANLSIQEKTNNYLLTDLDDVILVNASGNSVTINLHNGARIKKYVIKVINFTNSIIVMPTSGNINGVSNYVFSANNESITIIPYNNNWFTI